MVNWESTTEDTPSAWAEDIAGWEDNLASVRKCHAEARRQVEYWAGRVKEAEEQLERTKARARRTA